MEVEVVHFCFWDWMFECCCFFFVDGSFLRVFVYCWRTGLEFGLKEVGDRFLEKFWKR